MNLIFVWVEKFRCFEKQIIQLDYNYKIIERGYLDFEIENYKKKSIYNEGQIREVYAVLGKNGSGKSTLLDMIGYHNEDESFYFLVFEDDGEIKVLSSIALKQSEFLNNNPYKIKYGNKVYNSDCKSYDNLPLGIIKYENGIRKFKNANATYSNLNKKLSVISDPLFFDFIYKEKDFLNFQDSKQIEFVFDDVYYLDDIDEYLSYSNKDFTRVLVNINIDDSLFNVFIYIFVLFLAKIIRFNSKNLKNGNDRVVEYVNSIIFEFKKNLINLNNLQSFKDSILKEIIKIEKFINSLFNFKMYCFSSYYKTLLDYISELKFLYLYNGKICFHLSEINDLNIQKFKKFIEFITSRNTSYLYDLPSTLKVGSSTGEQAYVELIACIKCIIDEFNKIDGEIVCLLCLDEVEQNLHPEWCRILLKKIYELINNNAIRHKYLIYLTTHSPYVISDFTSDHIINLESNEGMEFNTFGANIHDILNKGMFLENSMGEFAYQCITDVINDLEGNNDESKYDDETIEYIINCIGEPFIKNHLKLLYENKRKRTIKQKYAHMTREELIELLERGEHDKNRN